MEWLVGYIAAVNLLGLIAMGIDKRKARRNTWRIKESTLFLIALLGGAAGCWVGMYGFRHKTRHVSFVWGIPLILVIELLFLYSVLG